MSGHSKWHNIQKTKGAADAKRSATFTKIADFAGEDLAHIRAYADGFVAQIKDINAQRAQAGAAASSVIGDGDASHLELPDNGAHFALGAVIDGEREELPA